MAGVGPQMRLIYFPVLFGSREMSPRFGQRSTNIGEQAAGSRPGADGDNNAVEC